MPKPKAGRTIKNFVEEWKRNVAPTLKPSTVRAAESHLRTRVLTDGHQHKKRASIHLCVGVFALKRNDLDFEKRVIRIRRTLDAAKRQMHSPKSRSSSADLPMPEMSQKRLHTSVANHWRQDEEILGYRMGRLPKRVGGFLLYYRSAKRERDVPPFLNADRYFYSWVQAIPIVGK